MMIIFIRSPRTITMLELLGFLCPLPEFGESGEGTVEILEF